MAGKWPADPNAVYPDCAFCKDKGITFDEYNGFRFCTCKAGLGLIILEPNAVHDANIARAKLQALEGK